MRRLSRRRTARYEAGEYLLDGPTLIGEALGAGVSLRRIYVEPDAIAHPVLESLATLSGSEVELRPVASGTLARVLDVVTPNGMVGVARMSQLKPIEVLSRAKDGGGPLLVLVDLADPGNAGTMLRAAEAAGCSGVLLLGHSTDPYAPKVVRASAGSVFRVPFASSDEDVSVVELLIRSGIEVWATTVSDGSPPENVDLTRPCAIVVGNEAHGLSRDLLEVCSGALSIPMNKSVESLNAAMAATVVVFEAARQRRSRPG